MRVELDSWNSRFGSYRSMRKLKGWKRTLTCKLFKARCSLCGGGEGMESLWEAYEEDTTNKISRSSKKKKNVKNNKSKSEFKYFDDGVSEDGDKDDQFMGNGQLCCFKALKMSTGKMNLGMGKPNLVKISKALKGFGWILTTAARPFSIFDGSTATKAKKQDDLEASRTFASYRLTKLDLEEASSTAISSSGDDENTLKSSSSFPSFVELDSWNSRFGSYRSMRKLKGWKRTLTCKLFKATCSLCGGGEGMESLWEAYEEDTTNKISRSSKKKKSVKNYKSKTEFKYFDDGVSEDGDKDDQFMGNGQLCCFKALKMSTGKMNLGMGKPNLVKISKALKGFGWLHHRHAKNVD
ncbi:hypothetical protein Tco_0729681 [Tanacetum coccineum]|uniref:Uncharacterized protein n=1 Tax=Tanacetum coccineum TaxID=301880 RepID=A0ABQ4YQ18_9ASTR